MAYLGKGIRILCGVGNEAASSQHNDEQNLYTSCAGQYGIGA